MDPLDLPKLDRDIARAARAERAWWRTLRGDAERAAAEAWFEPFRYVTTRTTFAQVSELAQDDPWREPLARWVHRLALTRIGARYFVDVARHRQEPKIELDAPEHGTFSVRDLVRRALADREPRRAEAWLEGLGAAAAATLAAERRAREAEIEITDRLGVPDRSLLDPFDREAMRREAEQLLAATDDLASSLLGRSERIGDLLARVVAREVPGVWPTRPDARWLSDLFGGTPLLEGLALDVGPTPSSWGAASFLRALARFGAAYARASVLGARPFVFASDPSELHPSRRGALLASLLVDPLFLRRRLAFSREAARRAARALAPALLASLRLDAAQSLVDFALASPTEIEEGSSEALKIGIDRQLGGVLPRPRRHAPQHLVAAFLAIADRDRLRDQFDEDWFTNPRGLQHLREADAAFAPDRVPADAIAGAAARVARALEALAS